MEQNKSLVSFDIDLSLKEVDVKVQEKEFLMIQTVQRSKKVQYCVLLILLSLYFFQGLVLSFILGTIPDILLNKGLSSQQNGLLGMSRFAFSLKFLFAPFLDTYYLKEFGQRKSYIVPLQFFGSLVIFIYSFLVQDDLDNLRIKNLFLFSVLVAFILSIQDIAIDGWGPKLLDEDLLSWASFCQSMGQFLGGIVGFNLLILFSSKQYCGESLGLDDVLWKISSFLQVTSITMLLSAFYIMFFVSENNQVVQVQEDIIETGQSGFKHTLDKIKFLFQNKNFRNLGIFLLTSQICFAAIEGVLDQVLLKELKYPREIISLISLRLKPLSFFSQILAGILAKKKKEFTIYYAVFVPRILLNLYNCYVLKNYDGQPSSIEIQLHIISAIDSFLFNLTFITIGAFFLRISDAQIAASQITFLNSITNFGRAFPNVMWLFLFDFLGLDTLIIISILLSAFYFLFFYQKQISLENLQKSEWSTNLNQ